MCRVCSFQLNDQMDEEKEEGETGQTKVNFYKDEVGSHSRDTADLSEKSSHKS